MKNILILLDSRHTYDRQVLKGIYSAFRQQQLNWKLVLTNADEVDFYKNSLSCDGVIIDAVKEKNQKLVKELQKPTIALCGSYIDCNLENSITYIMHDVDAISNLAIEHFKTAGFNQLGFFEGYTHESQTWVEERKSSFFNQAKKYNISHFLIPKKGTADWLKSYKQPIGILAASDEYARQLINLCDRHHINIPNQISILGIDHDHAETQLSTLSISSIDLKPYEMGRRAINELESLFKTSSPCAPTYKFIRDYQLIQGLSGQPIQIKDADVAKALRFIYSNFHSRIKVDQVVMHCGISRTVLDARFKKSLNKSIHDVLASVRIEHIKSRLIHSDQSIEDIAKESGYTTINYMYHAFTKHTGIPPAKFRAIYKDHISDVITE